MIIPWLIGAHNEIEGYDVHLSTVSVNGGLCKDHNIHDLPKPEERNGVGHGSPGGHLQTVLRRDRVRGERGHVAHIPGVPVVDVREAA